MYDYVEWVDCRASKTFDNTLVVGFVFGINSTFISIVLFCFICDLSFGMAYVRRTCGIRYSTWLVIASRYASLLCRLCLFDSFMLKVK